MEFWCFVKNFHQYDIYEKDTTILHFKTEDEAVNCFNEYTRMYIEDLHLDENETFVDINENSYYFTYSDDDLEVELTLDKIVL